MANKDVPSKLDVSIDSADAVLFPRIVATITQDMPISDIYKIITEMFGIKPIPEIDRPENKEFMEEACAHWQQNNDDELKDPALMIDYAMGLENE